MPRRPRLRSTDRQSVAPRATETANETPEMNPLCGLTRQFCEGPALAYPLLNPHMAYCARCAGALNRKGGRPVMKTAIGVVAAMTITATVAATASAEWRLYVNRDNRAWSLERAYISNDECDRAARTLYKSGQALGVGCAEYPQPPASRPAEYSRSNLAASRHVARADEPARVSSSRSIPRVAEYPVRATSSRQTAVAEPPPASQSHPAAVIFPPSGGIEVRPVERPKPAVASSRVKTEPQRQAAPMVAQGNAEDDKTSAAVALAKAAAEGTAASAREAPSEATAREVTVTASNTKRRTPLAIFGGVALVIGTGVVYSVHRVARTSPLRGLAVCLIEVGLLTAALAYPVVEMWTTLKLSTSIVLSTMPGVLAGLVIAGVGVIVLALELTRKPARPSTANIAVPPRDASTPERKPQPPVEPVRPLQPIRPLEAVHPFEAPKPAEPVKPPGEPAPVGGGA